MAIEKKTIDYAKETGDLGLLLEEAVSIKKEGRSITDIFDEATGAFLGSDKVDDEFRENPTAVAQTIGYHMGRAIAKLFEKQAGDGVVKKAGQVV